MEENQTAKPKLKHDTKFQIVKQSDGDEKSTMARKVYMDYNATTPLEPDVIQAVTEALQEAWGNPSSSYAAGQKAKKLIDTARLNVAMMVGGRPEDIIFTSGGTEANNLVFHSAVNHFQEIQKLGQNCLKEDSNGLADTLPHLISSGVEHDSVRLPLEHLMKQRVAEATFIPVSKVSGQAEVYDVMSAVRPNTCLVSIMMANNETGVLMPISELSRRIKILNQKRVASGLPWILIHTDAAQALGKVRVDVQELGVDYLTIVGHKAAEMVSQHWEQYEAHMRKVRDYLEEQLEAAFGKENIHFNSHFPGSERLPNTCNVSILGPELKGRAVLARCRHLLASVGAACHSDLGDRPSPVLLSSGIPCAVAQNALRLSVGRHTTKQDVDLIVEDLKQAVSQLETPEHLVGN
ncbi:selenocysteine lyase isoform X2 [Rhinatrema bivittatum]|uniref:selenocysteine lyase isoform X2 n=1 Tax=Rhinatrema bivittatum TaxID=194408 RepID=UPI00112988D1|nr:selenocysteine lyase isoform X2 [Rhinatrema bivittatum]